MKELRKWHVPAEIRTTTAGNWTYQRLLYSSKRQQIQDLKTWRNHTEKNGKMFLNPILIWLQLTQAFLAWIFRKIERELIKVAICFRLVQFGFEWTQLTFKLVDRIASRFSEAWPSHENGEANQPEFGHSRDKFIPSKLALCLGVQFPG